MGSVQSRQELSLEAQEAWVKASEQAAAQTRRDSPPTPRKPALPRWSKVSWHSPFVVCSVRAVHLEKTAKTIPIRGKIRISVDRDTDFSQAPEKRLAAILTRQGIDLPQPLAAFGCGPVLPDGRTRQKFLEIVG